MPLHRLHQAAVLFWFTGLAAPGINGFSLSMVASRQPSSGGFKSTLRPNFPQVKPSTDFGVSSGLISQLAVVALKLRLADQTDVSCDVTSSSSDILLRGSVGPVTVKGKGWRSGRGLTCRAIEATVERCDLDVGRILTHRKLSLTTPAKGKAMLALDHKDFGNFISHHLVKPPSIIENGELMPVQFIKEETQIDAKRGAITFMASCLDATWNVELRRGQSDGRRALIQVNAAEPDKAPSNHEKISLQLTEALSHFFNQMVFELDGTYLSFRDLMVTDKGASPTVMLALSILVKKFPSPGLDF